MNALQLNGFVKNLTNTNIAVLMAQGYSTFEAAGQLEWRDADRPVKLMRVGALNGVFMLMDPEVKISQEEAASAVEAMEADYRANLEQTLRLEIRQRKGQTPYYYIVPLEVAMAARVLSRDSAYMLVPTFETRLEEQKVHVGFIPAQLLFEELVLKED